MMAELQKTYFWLCMGADVEEYVKTCVKCQMTNYSTHPKIEKLKSLPILKQYIYSISINFMTNIPKVAINDAIIVIVCRLSSGRPLCLVRNKPQPKRWLNCF